MVSTSCDLNAPRCTTKAQQVRLHGSRGGVFVDRGPPRDPGDPLLLYFFKKIIIYNAPPSKFYVWSDVSHTHIHKLTSKFGELAGVRCHSAVTCPWFWNASSADQTRGGWWECLVWGWYGKSCHRHAPQLAKWRQCGGIRRLSCFLDLGVSRFASHPSCQ